MNAPARAAALFGAGSLPKVAWGKGSYITDTAGKRYVDGSSGPAAYCLGHGNEEVNAAIARQLDKIAHGYRYTFTSDPLEELTEIVRAQAGNGLERMVFVTGGSEAVESCLKIALQYHAARGEMSRRRFIARERSWHGNTLGALSVSGFKERRAPFEGALLDVSRLSPANAYRPPANVRAGRRRARLRRRAGAGDPAPRCRQGRRLHLRARGRRRRRRGAGTAGLRPRRARDLRPPWRAPDRRRGDVRHRPLRHLARARA